MVVLAVVALALHHNRTVQSATEKVDNLNSQACLAILELMVLELMVAVVHQALAVAAVALVEMVIMVALQAVMVGLVKHIQSLVHQ